MYARLLLFLVTALLASAQNYRVDTIAGFGTFGGDGGPATSALVNPSDVAVASDGTLYVADPGNYRIRKISPLGMITTLAGTGSGGYSGDGGLASAAQISGSYSIALDSFGNLYFTDEGNSRIREVTAAGVIKTIAGSGSCGVVTAGIMAVSAPLCDAEAVGLDTQGHVYFASSSKLWMVNFDGTLQLLAGTGGFGKTGDGGLATAAEIGYPSSIAIDQNGNLYLADTYNYVIRKIAADKRISTVPTIADIGTTDLAVALDAAGALYYVNGTTKLYKLEGSPTVAHTLTAPLNASCLALDAAGALYTCSSNLQRLLKIANGVASTVAGDYPYALDPVPAAATSVRLHLNSLLIGLAVDTESNVYFPELDGTRLQRIAKVTPAGTMTAVTTPLTLPTGGSFAVRAVVVSPAGGLYFSTFTQVYRAEPAGGVTLIAGAAGFPSALGDGGAATAAKITSLSSLAFDSSGNLYIAEPFASRVRKVTPQGIITTFAGTGQNGYSGDDGPASSARISTPVDVKVDSQGNVYIADLTVSVVRKVNAGGTISTVAGKGTSGFSGDGGPAVNAEFNGVAAIALDPSGNLFIADRPSAASTISLRPDNNRIRMVNTSGIISTIAGPIRGYGGEGLSALTTAFGGPVALAADAQGNIFVSEPSTQRIRKLTPLPAASSVVISSVNTASGGVEISQNGWMEIKGANLAPANVGNGVVWSSAPEFLQGKMPTALNGVSATINGKAAFVYFVSPGQINVLSPLDTVTGDVAVVVTNGGVASVPFTAKLRPTSPAFLRFGATNYIAATHGDLSASLLGPASMSVPGYTFTPAKPGETTVLYAVGFGLPTSTLVNGSSSQSGTLPALPIIQVGGITATVAFAGINGAPGLYQLNVVVPLNVPNGDVQVSVSYAGTVTPAATLSIQR